MKTAIRYLTVYYEIKVSRHFTEISWLGDVSQFAKEIRQLSDVSQFAKE